MTDFIIKKLPYDLSSHAGLAFVGKYLKRININSLIDSAFPVRSGVANSDILKSKMVNVNATKAEIVATANPGCMLQLQAGVQKHGTGARVAHVVELLDEAYRKY